MRLTWMGISVALLFVSGARAQDKTSPQNQKPVGVTKPVARNDALRVELLRRVDKDQDVRKRFIKDQKNRKILTEMNAVDSDDTRWMHGVVQKYGWPGRSLVGRDGASAAFLLVQHADLDHAFQKRCLALMQAAARHGDVSKPDLALLTDRVLVAEHKKQIYGTQFTTTPDGGMAPSPIEDERNVDKRRKSVGLPSMSEYRKLLQQMYGTGNKTTRPDTGKPGGKSGSSSHTPE